MRQAQPVRPRQRLGKYRVERRLAQGGFADVFQAYDTIEGIRVALKVPQPELISASLLDDFKKEVRLTAKLDHEHILPIKDASWIDGHFVIACRLGDGTLEERLRRRLSLSKTYDFAEQLLDALAYAHEKRVLHCDVKPDNLILFDDEHLRLTDFGLAKLSARTLQASGSGTLGYMAPEQAMGRPSARSDVFSAGLVLYRMFVGVLPQYPYDWPPPGIRKARRKLHPDLIALLRRALSFHPQARFADAAQMADALRALRSRVLAFVRGKRNGAAGRADSRKDWRELRLRQFLRRYKRELETVHTCARCEGPVSESMLACPWCGTGRKTLRDETRFPARCPRCKRGIKLDWTYCPWCYGPSVGPLSEREYSDRRYTARCANRACGRRDLMLWMRYCPWCHAKVKRPWQMAENRERCPRCRWGVLGEYWRTCPWCSRSLARAPKGAKRPRQG